MPESGDQSEALRAQGRLEAELHNIGRRLDEISGRFDKLDVAVDRARGFAVSLNKDTAAEALADRTLLRKELAELRRDHTALLMRVENLSTKWGTITALGAFVVSPVLAVIAAKLLGG